MQSGVVEETEMFEKFIKDIKDNKLKVHNILVLFTITLINVDKRELKYSNICTYLLSVMLEKTVCRKSMEYMNEKLLHPLGIYDMEFKLSPEGFDCGCCGMKMNVEELSRLGRLFYQKGMWDGKRIVSERWLEGSVLPQITFEEQQYGYQLWNMGEIGFQFVGMLGQACIMFVQKKVILTIISELTDFSDEPDKLNRFIWDDFYSELILLN